MQIDRAISMICAVRRSFMKSTPGRNLRELHQNFYKILGIILGGKGRGDIGFFSVQCTGKDYVVQLKSTGLVCNSQSLPWGQSENVLHSINFCQYF